MRGLILSLMKDLTTCRNSLCSAVNCMKITLTARARSDDMWPGVGSLKLRGHGDQEVFTAVVGDDLHPDR
jgi:hypothetical protein